MKANAPLVEVFHQLWCALQTCPILLGRKSSHSFIQHIFENLPYTRDCPSYWHRFLLWDFRTKRTIPGLENHKNHPAKLVEVEGETLQISFSGSGLIRCLANGLKNDLPFSLNLTPKLEHSIPTRSRIFWTAQGHPQRCNESHVQWFFSIVPFCWLSLKCALELPGYWWRAQEGWVKMWKEPAKLSASIT